MEKNLVYIIDDDNEILTLLKIQLKNEFYIKTESSPKNAISQIKDIKSDVIIVDQLMPEMSGIEFIEKLQELKINIPVILMTAYGSLEDAINAIKKGAFHYITKPVNIEELKLLIKQAVEVSSLKKELNNLKSLLIPDIIAESPKMKEILNIAKRIAKFDTTILISGESGTGKELIANFIHKHSRRKDKPFIAINCGAIPPDLLESELFGYKKGAFTGANTDKTGLLQEANKGTVFLDEIGELSPELQVKLLRVLQEKEIMPVGSNKPIKIDVRFIAATNKDLENLVKEGKFREDLYYRINVIPIKLPPLRERKEDILPLVNYFIKKFCSKYSLPEKKLSSEVINQLYLREWKGNVRELENFIERLILTSKEKVIKKIPDDVSIGYTNNQILKFKEAKIQFEKQYLQDLLITSNYNISRASKTSGISRAQLYRMLKKHNIMFQKDT